MKIVIDNERSNLLKKMLKKRARLVGSTLEKPGSSESLHCIFDDLKGRTFDIKGRKKIYDPHNVPGEMDRFDSPSKELFSQAVRDALD